jgi:hypothetical protein
MSGARNPYAAPKADIGAVPAAGTGVCRDGKLVRLGIGGSLPDRCIRCDGPAQGYRTERAAFWRPRWWRVSMWVAVPVLFIVSGIDPMVMIAFWVAVVGFAVADIFVRRKVVVEYGLCDRHRRLRAGVMGGFVASWVLLIGFAAAGAGDFRAAEHWWFWAIALAMFALAIVASLLYRIRLARITEDHVWLRGAGRRFQEALPVASE